MENRQVEENELIRNIYIIRGCKVMLDQDLATLYGIPTKRLNEQVKRNPYRFPADFMFQLTEDEVESLRSQNATSMIPVASGSPRSLVKNAGSDEISSKGGRRYLPYVFTEHGVLMLSSVLNSKVAIEVNIRIMRVYVRLREILSVHEELSSKIDFLESKIERNSEEIILIFDALQQLNEAPDIKDRVKIGFHSGLAEEELRSYAL